MPAYESLKRCRAGRPRGHGVTIDVVEPPVRTGDLAVIVVTHQARARALATLDDLAADPDRPAWDVVLIDNASTDGTVAAVRERYPRVRTIRNDVGRGFAAAVNQGLAATATAAVAVITTGTRIPPGTLATLRATLDAGPGIGAAGPLIRHPDSTPQRHGLFRPSAFTALVVLLGLTRLPVFAGEARRYYGSHAPGPPCDVDQLSGACLVLNRDALEAVGGFDERFFLYCEDTDWCLRARAAGWRIRFVPDVAVTREKSASSRAASGETIRLYYRSLRRFYAKHHATTPLPIRALWSAGAYLTEWLELGSNALRRRKGLRY